MTAVLVAQSQHNLRTFRPPGHWGRTICAQSEHNRSTIRAQSAAPSNVLPIVLPASRPDPLGNRFYPFRLRMLAVFGP